MSEALRAEVLQRVTRYGSHHALRCLALAYRLLPPGGEQVPVLATHPLLISTSLGGSGAFGICPGEATSGSWFCCTQLAVIRSLLATCGPGV